MTATDFWPTEWTRFPDGTHTANVYSNGVLLVSTNRNGDATTRYYDGFLRLLDIAYPRGGGQHFLYDNNNNVQHAWDAWRETVTTYDSRNRPIRITHPDDLVTTNDYYQTGELKTVSGARAYPVKYLYDGAGRLMNLNTYRDWTDFDSSAPDTTTWAYDVETGRLKAKVYADNTSNTFHYAADGLLTNRVDARGVSSIYRHDDSGAVTNIVYSDGTTGPQIQYSRAGLPTNIVDAAGTRTLAYNERFQVVRENLSSAYTLEYDYDQATGNRTLMRLIVGSTTQEVAYAYDTQSRLSGIAWTNSAVGGGARSVAYSRLANSDLISGWSFTNADTRVASVERSYNEYLDRLEAVTNRLGDGTVVSAFAYGHNDVDQRTRIDREGGEKYAAYMYDSYGQLTNAQQNLVQATQTNTFGFQFDQIGNREQTAYNATTADYSANLLNQYTNVQGTNLLYDLAGNVTNDGVRAYVWDGENRLVEVTPLNPAVGDMREEIQYDYMGRMWMRYRYPWTGSSWGGDGFRHRYFYDGWNLLCEHVRDDVEETQCWDYYVWGLDLSGSLQGAGGVGGLLSVTRNPTLDTQFFLADGNGNVMTLVDDTGTNVVASYEYSPFGEVITSSGTLASDNPFRFSTKYFDQDTGLGYWGYRWYDAGKGRWLSRDLIEEAGGVNLYGYCGNDGVGGVDLWGMQDWPYYGLPKSEYDRKRREEDWDPMGLDNGVVNLDAGNFIGKAIAKSKKSVGGAIDPQWRDIYTVRLIWSKGYDEVQCSKPDEAFPSLRTDCGKALVEYSGECSIKVSQRVGVGKTRDPDTGEVWSWINEYYKAIKVEAILDKTTVSCSPDNPCEKYGSTASAFPSVKYQMIQQMEQSCKEFGEEERQTLEKKLKIKHGAIPIIGSFVSWLSSEREEIAVRASPDMQSGRGAHRVENEPESWK